jgi:hypothetical protein
MPARLAGPVPSLLCAARNDRPYPWTLAQRLSWGPDPRAESDPKSGEVQQLSARLQPETEYTRLRLTTPFGGLATCALTRVATTRGCWTTFSNRTSPFYGSSIQAWDMWYDAELYRA